MVWLLRRIIPKVKCPGCGSGSWLLMGDMKQRSAAECSPETSYTRSLTLADLFSVYAIAWARRALREVLGTSREQAEDRPSKYRVGPLFRRLLAM